MPHLFVNRLRKHSIGRAAPDDLRIQFKWEIINACCYLTGGVIFIAGSILFLPDYEEHVNVGSWLFILGSFFYLFVSSHDLYEVFHAKKPKLVDAMAASAYCIGGLIFIIGSYQFLPKVGAYTAGAYNFIIGSLFFIGGAVTNSIQIFDSPTRASAMYANFTAVCYVIGSTLFLSGSVPYLWDFESQRDSHTLHRYLGSQFVVGSVLFFLGGSINLYRAYLIFQHGLSESKREFQGTHEEVVSGYHISSLEELPAAGQQPRTYLAPATA